MDGFVSLGYLGSLAGCLAIVTAFTQIAKMYVDISPKWWVLISSAVVIAIRQWLVLGDLSPHGLAEAAINFGICICAASGLYEFAVKPAEKGKD